MNKIVKIILIFVAIILFLIIFVPLIMGFMSTANPKAMIERANRAKEAAEMASPKVELNEEIE